jgi:hypothetical protein
MGKLAKQSAAHESAGKMETKQKKIFENVG